MRSFGIDAEVYPDSDAETLELGGLYSTGEECFPHKVTLGNFLKIARQPGFEPSRTAFFMPTSDGPCRFGQYAPYLRKVMNDLGYPDVMIFSPTCRDSYDGVDLAGADSQLTMWMALVSGDLLTRFLLKTRPYEVSLGDSDDVFRSSVEDFSRVLEVPGVPPKQRRAQLVEEVVRMRDRFHAVPANYTFGKPLIGLVGEIFCRQDTFSNDDIARRIERLGGECWISDIAEWIWYTNWSQETKIREERGRLNLDFARARIKSHTQHIYEQALLAPVEDDLVGYEEPEDVREILRRSEPYLPPHGCLGEMVLSVGKAIYLAEKGAAGIIDISPFTCMNGVICEGVYPSVSADLNELPIRVCYFDGVNANIDQDLEIFLDLARAYQKRSRWMRRCPAYFD